MADEPQPDESALALLDYPSRFPLKVFGRHSDDDFEQVVVDLVRARVPQAEHIGLEMPDPDLKWNEERGHYDFGAIDWDEFWRVVKGHGPMARDRIRDRKKAWDDGAWVREAAQAYAEKQAAKAA